MKYISTILLVGALSLSAREYHQVTATEGSETVNGVTISVEKEGGAVVHESYCEEVTTPYFIGYQWAGYKSVSGSYTFTFDPPVEGVKLNFSGVTNTATNKEIVKLSVNGAHYPIPFVGFDNECDGMAMLTDEGNITGGEGLTMSGWQGTVIDGPITSLKVHDEVIMGQPSGALFSLYAAGPATSVIFEEVEISEKVLLTLQNSKLFLTDDMKAESTISIVNSAGRVMSLNVTAKALQTGVDVSSLADGVYYLKIISAGKSTVGKFVIQ